jgi:hypothetical protein
MSMQHAGDDDSGRCRATSRCLLLTSPVAGSADGVSLLRHSALNLIHDLMLRQDDRHIRRSVVWHQHSIPSEQCGGLRERERGEAVGGGGGREGWRGCRSECLHGGCMFRAAAVACVLVVHAGVRGGRRGVQAAPRGYRRLQAAVEEWGGRGATKGGLRDDQHRERGGSWARARAGCDAGGLNSTAEKRANSGLRNRTSAARGRTRKGIRNLVHQISR